MALHEEEREKKSPEGAEDENLQSNEEPRHESKKDETRRSESFNSESDSSFNDAGENEKNSSDKKKPGFDFNKSRFVFPLILGGIFIALWFGSSTSIAGKIKHEKDWSQFTKDIEKNRFSRIEVMEREYTAFLAASQDVSDGKEIVRVTGPNPGEMSEEEKNLLFQLCRKNGIELEFKRPSMWLPVLLNLLPWILLLLLAYFFVFRQLRGPGGPGGVLSFGKSRAQLITKDKSKKTFKDVAGIDEAKDEVSEIVGFLKNPKKFERLGGRIPKGVLLIGQPGTGKTLLAKAIAGEAGVPFFSISGSDFVEMFVGVGASRVRDLFQQAKENSPCIVFLDEIDAVGRRRGAGLGGGHDEREQTLNEILVQMDGFGSDENVIVMAATNRPDVLDKALLRPGRFDRHIYVDLPDVKGREEILNVHSKRVKLAPDTDLSILAKSTPMFSGADLENLVNEAALLAVMKDHDAVHQSDLDEARDKVLWGREKKSRVFDEQDRWLTAYHEAGHALIGHLLPEVDKPHKITIIPRGPSLGATHFMPEKDVTNLTRKQLIGRIVVAFGGRISEEMFTGDVSTGAQNDIEQATKMARKMVCEWGMSERLGPIKYEEDDENVFLGRELGRIRHLADGTASVIDEEVRRIIDECFSRSRDVLEAHREDVELLAQTLMEYEVISGKELDYLLKNRRISRKAPKRKIIPRPLPKKQNAGEEKAKDGGNVAAEGSSPSPQPA
jgi:cell division protease FtsH